MRAALAAGLLLAALLPGCAGKEADVEVQAITPGVWDVQGHTDHLMVWARNHADAPRGVAWGLTMADGDPLPAGWQVTFDPPAASLAAAGTKTRGARGYDYPDWTMSLLTLTVPEGQAAGTFQLRLDAGNASRRLEMVVHDARGAVSGPGSQVGVQYEGRFDDTGEVFDDGAFPTTLGQGDTVAGFDYGLMGLALGETATLVIPPPFGYGFDPPPSHAPFAGKTLRFEVTITSLSG